MTHPQSLRLLGLALALAAPFALVSMAGAQATSTDPAAPATEEAAPVDGTSSTETAAEAAPTAEAAEDTATPPPATPPSEEPTATTAAPAAEGDATQLAAPTGDGEGETEGEGEGEGAAPATTENESEAIEAQAAAEPLAWRNSFFSYSVSSTLATFCRDCYLSYNPTVYQFLSFTPRWYVDASTFFFFSLGAFQEWTDSDGTAYNREFSIGDMLVELRRTIPFEGFIFIPAARLTFPTSKLSQAAQRYVNGAVGLTAVRPIPEALGMTVAAVFRYQHWFAGSNVSRALTGDTGCLAPLPTGSTGGAAGGSTGGAESDTSYLCDSAFRNESDRIVAGVSINITPAEHLTVSLSAFYVWAYAAEGGGAVIDTLGGPVNVGPTAGVWRNFTSYGLSVAYDVAEWANLSLSWSNSTVLAPLYGPDGSVYTPFNPDQQISLAATFTLDGIYNTLTAGGEDDGLTPEERQRRRQGLALRGSDDDDAAAPVQPTTTTF